MSKNRIDRGKVARGGAPLRKYPSKGATYLVKNKLVTGRTLDYGCGYGLDAETFGWESYDPYYNPVIINGVFDTIVCTNVFSAVSRVFREEILKSMLILLSDSGKGYIIVPRNIPLRGKYSGFNRRPQYHVILTLDSVYKDTDMEIYLLKKDSVCDDKTLDNL